MAVTWSVLAACGPSTEATLAEDASARRGPSITSVMTDDGFTQVRQNANVSLVSSIDSRIDLGEGGHPGNNALSVTSGFAIDDVRQNTQLLDRYVLAAGTTLNGVSFDGQTIDGPAELAPYYRVVDFDSGLQF